MSELPDIECTDSYYKYNVPRNLKQPEQSHATPMVFRELVAYYNQLAASNEDVGKLWSSPSFSWSFCEPRWRMTLDEVEQVRDMCLGWIGFGNSSPPMTEACLNINFSFKQEDAKTEVGVEAMKRLHHLDKLLAEYWKISMFHHNIVSKRSFTQDIKTVREEEGHNELKYTLKLYLNEIVGVLRRETPDFKTEDLIWLNPQEESLYLREPNKLFVEDAKYKWIVDVPAIKEMYQVTTLKIPLCGKKDKIFLDEKLVKLLNKFLDPRCEFLSEPCPPPNAE